MSYLTKEQSLLTGVSTLRSSNLSLRISSAQLITSTSVDRLEVLAAELDKQAEVIKEKDEAYQQLTEIYQRSLKGKEGYGRLQNAIESVGELPEVEDLDSIQSEITTTRELLGEITPE
jgi:hypothetical protein